MASFGQHRVNLKGILHKGDLGGSGVHAVAWLHYKGMNSSAKGANRLMKLTPVIN